METIPFQDSDEMFNPDDLRWQGTFPPAGHENLGLPPPQTVFESVAIQSLPTADKKPPTFQILRTTYWLATGTKKDPDHVKMQDTENQKD